MTLVRTGVVVACLMLAVGCAESFGRDDSGPRRDGGPGDAGEELACTIETSAPIVVDDARFIRLGSFGETVYALFTRRDLEGRRSLYLARFERGALEPEWVTRVFEGTSLALLSTGYLATFASGTVLVAVDWAEREVETLDPFPRTLIALYAPDGSPVGEPFRSDVDQVSHIVGLENWVALQLWYRGGSSEEPDILLIDEGGHDWPAGALSDSSLRFTLPAEAEGVARGKTLVRMGAGIGVLYGEGYSDERIVAPSYTCCDMALAFRAFDARGAAISEAEIFPPPFAVVGPCAGGEHVALFRRHEGGLAAHVRRVNASGAFWVRNVLPASWTPDTCAWSRGDLLLLASNRADDRVEVFAFDEGMSLRGRAEWAHSPHPYFERTVAGVVVGSNEPEPPIREERERASLFWMECVEGGREP